MLANMLKCGRDLTDKVEVVRRLVFASAVLPVDLPNYWDTVSSFANAVKSTQGVSVTSEQAKVFIENLNYLEPDSFSNDYQLSVELQSFAGPKGQPLGIVLVSNNQACLLCGSGLLIKADRPRRITIYTDQFGTTDGTHYRKICKRFRAGCPFVQHYGHYCKDGDVLYYNEDFHSHKYFMSTRETAFEMALLDQLDAEVSIGQLSYKQRSEIYNIKHGYDSAKKNTGQHGPGNGDATSKPK